MAPLPANDINVWEPPGFVGNSGATFLADPNYVRGWNTQTVYEVGTAGTPQTYDVPEDEEAK
jgi:hypothetical protein